MLQYAGQVLRGGLSLSKISGTADISFRKGQLLSTDGGAQALRVFGLLNFVLDRSALAVRFL